MTKQEKRDKELPLCEMCHSAADLGREDFRYVVETVTGKTERFWCCETCQEELAQGTCDGYELSE